MNAANGNRPISRSKTRWRAALKLSSIASLFLLTLCACSTPRVSEEQLKLLCEAPPGYLMQKAQELPELPADATGRDLINDNADLARRYNDLADQHDALIDRIEAQQKRLNGK